MSTPTALATEKQSYCTFCIDELYCGIEVSMVQEVIRHQTTTAVPLAPGLVRGLMNLRGQIVTALDLRSRFGLAPASSEEDQMNVVIRTAEGPISLLVDRIGEVAEVDSLDFEPPPEALSEEIKKLINGVYKVDDQLLLIVDTDTVIQVAS